MIKVAVDAFGGDNSPQANVFGTVKALNEIKDLEVFLVGKEDVLNELLAPLKYDKERLHVVHASEIITCNDKPTEAIKTKKDSSLCKCIELMKGSEDINALVSVGSTGAILAGASDEDANKMESIGSDVGYAFQIQDDILDVTGTTEVLGKPAGSDDKNEKSTYVTLFGVEKAEALAEEYTNKAIESLGIFEDSHELCDLAKKLMGRKV